MDDGPMTMQQSPLVSKLNAYVGLSENELSVLDGFQRHRRSFAAGADLVHEGQTNPTAFLLSEGWVSSYKVLRGGGRQIVDFQIPGDFLGLRSVLFRTADHNIEPVTQVSASEFNAKDMLDAFAASPRLAAAVLWSASSDEAVVVERLVSLGRRDATERTAHFLLELWARLKLVGLATREGYRCPLSQYHLADALGLSAVHVNRVLRQLREEGFLTFRNGKVTFDDLDRLIAATGFDAAYLDHDGPMMK
jgi:CRP-like cAMP-binding protein